MLAKVTPAVVNISVTTRASLESNPLFRDPFFRRFFDQPERNRQRSSAGSGVIVDAAKGYVLTNHHVIKDAQEVMVTLKDRRQFEAKLVGTDPGTDIALLKVEAKDLSALAFGDSDTLAVGDFVVAIGNPFGLGQTVTSGIVSALGRSGLGIEGYEDFIQTDAPINPGNSGGALVDLKGELIGINTAILGPSGGNVGIGFAVPSSMARSVMNQLVRFGEVRRGRIGLETQDLTPELAQAMSVRMAEGAVVTRVLKSSPAEKADLRAGDVILAVAGKPARGSMDVRNRVSLTPIGEEVELRVLRQGRQFTTRLRIAEPYEAIGAGSILPQLAGAAVSDIEPGMPMYGEIEGAIVVRLQRASPAQQAGLRPGDVIYGVNRTRVRSVEQLSAALRNADTPLTLAIRRGDTRLGLLIR